MKARIPYICVLMTFGALLLFQPVFITARERIEEQPVTTETSIESTGKIQEKTDRRFIVYYFHGIRRCMSCRTIEMYTHDSIQSNFADQLESGRIEWQLVNFTDQENKHFVDDFGLFTQSVVLVEMKGDEIVRWKNLKDVWTLLRKKDAFYEYIRDEVSSFLAEG